MLGHKRKSLCVFAHLTACCTTLYTHIIHPFDYPVGLRRFHGRNRDSRRLRRPFLNGCADIQHPGESRRQFIKPHNRVQISHPCVIMNSTSVLSRIIHRSPPRFWWCVPVLVLVLRNRKLLRIQKLNLEVRKTKRRKKSSRVPRSTLALRPAPAPAPSLSSLPRLPGLGWGPLGRF